MDLDFFGLWRPGGKTSHFYEVMSVEREETGKSGLASNKLGLERPVCILGSGNCQLSICQFSGKFQRENRRENKETDRKS